MGTIVVDEERQRDRLVYLLFSPPLEIKDYKQSDFTSVACETAVVCIMVSILTTL
jgi:hypothetical protein